VVVRAQERASGREAVTNAPSKALSRSPSFDPIGGHRAQSQRMLDASRPIPMSSRPPWHLRSSTFPNLPGLQQMSRRS
jgi:hypothetical protein